MSANQHWRGAEGERRGQVRLWLAACLAAATACGGPPPPVTAPTGSLDAFIAEVVQPLVEAARAEPKSAQKRGTLGLAYEANEMWSLALDAFENAERLDPGAPEWILHGAIVLYRLGDSAEADRRIIELSGRFPDFAPARFRHGVLLLQRGELDQARAEFAATAAKEPGFAGAYIAEAEVLIEQDDPATALQRVSRALQIDATDRSAIYVRGLANRALGNHADAERDLVQGAGGERKFLLDEPGQRLPSYMAGVSVQIARAQALLQAGRPADAVAMLEKARAKRPDDVNVLNNLAVAYRGAGNARKAIELLDRARTSHPDHFPTLINLSGAYLATGDSNRALETAAKAVSLVPTNGRVHFALAQAFASQDRYEEARLSLEESLRHDTSDPQVFGVLGEVLMKLDRFGQAEEQWKVMIQRQPAGPASKDNLVRAHINLVMCQIQLRKTREANGTLAALRQLAPGHKAIAQLEARLARGPR